ncbi:hypothetical protein B1812_06680 [Methylocystis bryophila]|uniref:Uncharacterized protein n=1 Tax=Methylocystis bryophila TaxID=655015 RepID=A0A1W6MTD4_9HYPH|nr:hypothetical protein B1812_06680 [Methylocystis bryophila]
MSIAARPSPQRSVDGSGEAISFAMPQRGRNRGSAPSQPLCSQRASIGATKSGGSPSASARSMASDAQRPRRREAGKRQAFEAFNLERIDHLDPLPVDRGGFGQPLGLVLRIAGDVAEDSQSFFSRRPKTPERKEFIALWPRRVRRFFCLH